MTVFLWCLGILGYTAIWFALGLLAGLVGHAKGQWIPYLQKFIRPQPLAYIDHHLKEMVQAGDMTAKAAEAFSQRLWNKQAAEDERKQWVAAHRDALYAEESAKKQEAVDDTRDALGI